MKYVHLYSFSIFILTGTNSPIRQHFSCGKCFQIRAFVFKIPLDQFKPSICLCFVAPMFIFYKTTNEIVEARTQTYSRQNNMHPDLTWSNKIIFDNIMYVKPALGCKI